MAQKNLDTGEVFTKVVTTQKDRTTMEMLGFVKKAQHGGKHNMAQTILVEIENFGKI